jgi:hypothetical protein
VICVDGAAAVDGAMKVGKVATAMDHLRNNRIEYLVLLVFSHMLGITDLAISKASGVCG